MIEKIYAGGQSGVDRAALDTAIFLGIPYMGWCPKGGWAEDYPTPPGILIKYPLLQETASPSPEQRTEWNVRDSDATLILTIDQQIDCSPGTRFTETIAQTYSKPYKIIALNTQECIEDATAWLVTFQKKIRLNIAGPRQSESPGIYEQSKTFLLSLLKSFKE